MALHCVESSCGNQRAFGSSFLHYQAYTRGVADPEADSLCSICHNLVCIALPSFRFRAGKAKSASYYYVYKYLFLGGKYGDWRFCACHFIVYFVLILPIVNSDIKRDSPSFELEGYLVQELMLKLSFLGWWGLQQSHIAAQYLAILWAIYFC